MNYLFSSHEQQNHSDMEEFLPTHKSLVSSAYELVHNISWQIDPEMVQIETKAALQRFHQQAAGHVATATSREVTVEKKPLPAGHLKLVEDPINNHEAYLAYLRQEADANGLTIAETAGSMDYPEIAMQAPKQDNYEAAA